MTTIRLATFNVNSVRSRLPVLERWLPSSGVDFLFLQETKVVDPEFPCAFFEAMGYKAYYCGEKAYNGVAVISRLAIQDVRFGFLDGENPNFSTRVALMRSENLTVLNTYVPQGKSLEHPDYEVKKRFLERVRGLFEKELSNDKLFAWVGDINVAPSEFDVTNPRNKKDHVCFHTDIRQKYDWVKSWGLTDLLRHYHPEEGVFTFFDYRVKESLSRNIGWRIDHILVTPNLADCAIDCRVDREPRSWEKPSDHTPVIADFII